ncbi:MAG: MFS transporter [Lentisphaeria bacterium]|nr:MFS transporter [Lentisphaeria bacterium]
MPYWVVNLIVLWISQFCASVGFSLSMPFAPYYIQDLGVTDADLVKLWTTVITAGAPLSMALVSPVWGMLSDRYGRKPMVLRATLGAGLILSCAAFAPNVYIFAFLRVMQGLFSGVASAVITLVACNTPGHRQGLALGSLGSAQFSGNMTGLFIGGFMADRFGYAKTFLFSGAVLFLAAVLVFFFVREKFTAVQSEKAGKRQSFREKFAALGPGTVLLALVLWMSITRRMDGGLLAIYIQELYGSLDGVAIWSGMINGVGSLGALLAGIGGSLLLDRFHPRRLLYINAVGASASMILIALASSHLMLIPFRFLLMIFLAGFDPILNTWLSKVTPPEKKGAVFGFAQMAKSTGMTLGPCLGGLIAWLLSTRMVFWAAAIMFLILLLVTRQITAKFDRMRNSF